MCTIRTNVIVVDNGFSGFMMCTSGNIGVAPNG